MAASHSRAAILRLSKIRRRPHRTKMDEIQSMASGLRRVSRRAEAWRCFLDSEFFCAYLRLWSTSGCRQLAERAKPA